jgi:hypothetical protein
VSKKVAVCLAIAFLTSPPPAILRNLFTLAIAQAFLELGFPPVIVGLKLVENAPAPLLNTFFNAPRVGAFLEGCLSLNSAILFLRASSFSAEISMSPALLLVDAVPSGFSFEPLIRSLGGAGVEGRLRSG